MQASDLFASLRELGATKKSYSLKESFLEDAEIDVFIIKALQKPMRKEYLAYSLLRCSKNALQTRIDTLRNGKRVGAMEIRLDLRYGGKLARAVHPVMLALTDGELAALAGALDARMGEAIESDERGALERVAGNMLYQLTEAAKATIISSNPNMGKCIEEPPLFAG